MQAASPALAATLPAPDRPAGTPVPSLTPTVFANPDMRAFYGPVMLGASTLGELSLKSTTLTALLGILDQMTPDDYVRYLQAYYRLGLQRYGEHWRYADIATVLWAVASLAQPSRYLEIGVRRARSMAVMAAVRPQLDIVGFDMWMADYADMPNPGPDFVRSELSRLNHTGRLELITGDSHATLPQYFAENPADYFDVITVDGDHSKEGAEQDLRDVMPRLKLGGVLIFDDVASPVHPYLNDVWQRVVVADSRFACWQFRELGYGVALAVRVSA